MGMYNIAQCIQHLDMLQDLSAVPHRTVAQSVLLRYPGGGLTKYARTSGTHALSPHRASAPSLLHDIPEVCRYWPSMLQCQLVARAVLQPLSLSLHPSLLRLPGVDDGFDGVGFQGFVALAFGNEITETLQYNGLERTQFKSYDEKLSGRKYPFMRWGLRTQT